MASESEIASASIAVQMETSRLESQIAAGEDPSFDQLDSDVAALKAIAQPDAKGEKE